MRLQAQSWQQQADYTIDVTLDPSTKTLDGFEKIVYRNNSPDTLRFIWFHLWPNAYKNDRTAFSDGLLQGGDTRFYFSGKEQRGYINRLDFRVNGAAARMEDHPQHIDIIKLVLPRPLAPGEAASISTPFHVRLPYNFSRGGFDGNSFQVTQWYPKPAVYDATGWHPLPYLDQGEFYSEFGSFDVRITIPQNYVLAATGDLQDSAALATMKRGITAKTEPKARKAGSPAPRQKMHVSLPAPVKTVRYTQSRIHDFAWFANPAFDVKHDTCRLASGRVVDVFSYYTPAERSLWSNSIAYAKEALRFYSDAVGEYPYNTLSVVQGPQSFGGGMEYPTITVISPMGTARDLDMTIAHEIGHNWFYGMLASNERDHPWMDEGINTFYEEKYGEARYGSLPKLNEIGLQTLAIQRKDQPISTAAPDFKEMNYGLVAYHKTAHWLALVEQRMGADAFRSFMQGYFRTWAFHHPQPGDFNESLRRAFPSGADALIALQTQTGLLPNQPLAGFRVVSPLQPASIRRYLRSPSRGALLVSPALGANAYDRLMIGALFTNMKLPPVPLQFLAVPLYSTGARRFAGIGRVSYSLYPRRGPQKLDGFVSVSTFSNNEFTDDKGTRHLARFKKLAPGLTIYLREKDPHSLRQRFVQWKSFFIGEQPFRISDDSLITATDTTIRQRVQTVPLQFSVHQLTIGVQDFRALYPYSANLTVQASRDFIRLALEGSYFFNYARGGLAVRLFAGKLFYDENRARPYGLYADRFFLNMTGANGEEDYTYSHYFIGRNKFEGLASQQIAIRDGGFKLRTDLLASKIGKSGNWLAAANFNTSLPGLPVHLFADIGTYAEAWTEDGADRFLFDAGLHLPLFKVVHIYLPIIYSRPFSDYVKSTYGKNRLLKTATFSIDLQALTAQPRKLMLF
ncbi:MAG: family metallopeptidase [Flaviaesturariibacter sp.]|nr:family metallopeptidase [Flaviaesturariibacter sp.]